MEKDKRFTFDKHFNKKSKGGADEAFDPTEYLEGDQEQYFQNLQQWKKDFEKSYLEQYPFLHQPVRHKNFTLNLLGLRELDNFFIF